LSLIKHHAMMMCGGVQV